MRALGFAIAAILTLVMSTPSSALKPRPTVDSADVCWGRSTDKGCEGLICYCCYNEGCYICNKDTYDCVWDGSYRIFKRLKTMTGIRVPPAASPVPPWSKSKGTSGDTSPPASAR